MKDPDPHIVRAGTLPTPFSADELRAGLPAGTVVTTVSPDGEVSVHAFSECDAEGCVYEVREVRTGPADDTLALGNESMRVERTTWAELQGHAAFDAAVTTRTEDVIEHRLGTVRALRYDVATPDGVRTFWFDPSRPGMPVRLEVRAAGGELVGGFDVVEWAKGSRDTGGVA